MENATISVYKDWELVQSIKTEAQCRSMDYRNGLLVVGFFHTNFNLYHVNEDDTGLTLIKKFDFVVSQIQMCKFLSNKELFISFYGDGFHTYRLRKDCLTWTRWQKRKKARDTKVNRLIKIGKTKYLCFDWDKCRYFIWDKKKNTLALWSNRLHQGKSCITGEKLTRHYEKSALLPFTEPFKCHPFILSKEENMLCVLNVITKEVVSLGKMYTFGLLQQKMFKVRGEMYGEGRQMTVFTTKVENQNQDNFLVKAELDRNRVQELF